MNAMHNKKSPTMNKHSLRGIMQYIYMDLSNKARQTNGWLSNKDTALLALKKSGYVYSTSCTETVRSDVLST